MVELDDGGAGAVYVFKRNSQGDWVEDDKLTASIRTPGGRFGRSIAVDGKTVIFGAALDDDKGTHAGAAYVFKRNSQGQWNETDKLTADDGVAFDRFGHGVALDGKTAIIGAYLHDDNGTDAGAAYVFKINNQGIGQQADKLLASGGKPDDQFGQRNPGFDKGRTIIGTHLHDDKGSNSGAAHVFKINSQGQGQEVQELIASDAKAGAFFGLDSAVMGDIAFVGAPGDRDKGAVYVFDTETVNTSTCNGFPVTFGCQVDGSGPTLCQGDANSNVIIGTSQPDVIVGGKKNDVIRGRGGDDVICGNQGSDRLFGNAGNDVLLGGKGDDTLQGNAGDDTLTGGQGKDDLFGGSGDDTLRGNAPSSNGADFCVGGPHVQQDVCTTCEIVNTCNP